MKQKIKRNKTSGSDLVTISILKQELKRFATKDDLKRFATKDDLKNFATKKDLHTLKTDISNFKIDILAEISGIEVKAIDREQAYHSDVMTKFDKIMKKLETMQ
jgi:ribosome-associated translation inhibitor RaiA